MIAFSTVFYALECPPTVFLSPTREITFWQKFVMLRNKTNILVNTIIVLWPWAAISKPLFIISFMSYRCPLPRNSHIENIYFLWDIPNFLASGPVMFNDLLRRKPFIQITYFDDGQELRRVWGCLVSNFYVTSVNLQQASISFTRFDRFFMKALD